ncbi:MAG: DUF4340 domain-containing protein [Verrucomicrobiota bacterium]
MITRRTIGISALSLVLGLVLGGWQARVPSTEERREARKYVALLHPKDVCHLHVSGPSGDVLLSRSSPAAKWEFEAPVLDVADPDRMQSLLEALCRLPVVERVEEPGEADPNLGFDLPNETRVRLRDASGRTLFHLSVGRAGVFEETFYVEEREEQKRGKIYLVRSPIWDWLSQPVETLRDRQLLRIPLAEILRYQLTSAWGEVDVERRLEGEQRWFLRAPLAARANDDLCLSLLEELSRLEAESFLDDQSILGREARPETEALFQLHLAGRGDEDPLEIRFLQERDEQGVPWMLASRSDRKTVLKIRDNLVERLPRNTDQLRYPYLTDIEAKTVARIEIESRTANPNVDLRSNGLDWLLHYRGQTPFANEKRIQRMLDALNAEPVIEFRSSVGDVSGAYGLARPAVTLAVTTSAASEGDLNAYRASLEEARAQGGDLESIPKPDTEVEVQRYLFGMGEGPLVNVQKEGEPFVVAVDPALLSSKIPLHPLKWLGLRIFRFHPRELRSVEVKTRASQWKVRYDPRRNAWSGEAGESSITDDINPRRAEAMAYALGSMTAVDWLTERREALTRLARPKAVVQLRLARRERSGTVKEYEVTMKIAPVNDSSQPAFFYGQLSREIDVFVLSADTVRSIVSPVVYRAL